MKKLFQCAAMLLALHCGFAHAQPPHPDPNPIGQKLVASDGSAGDSFGVSVSVDGDIAVIGANLSDTEKGADAGSAYAFIRRQDGKWTQEAKLVPTDGNADYHFGTVSLSGNTVLIGATWDDSQGEKSGAAYVFVRAADGTWTQQAKLLPNDGTGWDVFGDRVALDGDIAAVGAWGDDDKGTNSGSVYIFVRAADGTWSQKQKLLPNDGAAGDNFGYPVSLNNGTALIGAAGKNSYSGSAYVFVQDADGTWSQKQKLLPSDGAAEDRFGHSVSLKGDTALIGAIFDDDNGADSGSVYVFTRAADGTWSQKEKLTADDGAAGDRFCVVSLNGNKALIGAPGKDSNAGSAYVFVQEEDGSWHQQTKLTPDDETADDQFGVSVSLDSSNALVGARGLPSAGKIGYAYIYDLPSSSITYTVTPSAGTGGSISPDAPQTVNQGATTSFIVLADSGYKIEKVEGCGGTLSGNTYTTAPVTEDCAVTASFMPHAARNGMTWGFAGYNSTLDISRAHCFGTPKPNGLDGCNPYQGDTSCSAALPVLCVKVDKRPRPPYALAKCSTCAMSDEYYNGWAEGSIGLTAPAQGNAFASLADVNAYCAAQLGEGYRVAEHHTGRYVMGMDENNFYGSTWPKTTSAGGWGLYGPGQLADTSRFWVDINDQNANCWGRSPGWRLSVSSSGASGVAITGSCAAYSGTTNYTKTGIPSGTAITLTAPAASGGKSFFMWGGCDSTNTAARTCTVTMYKDKAVTANFKPIAYTVTPSAGTGGSISPNSPQSIEHGNTVSFEVAPSTGYTIDTVEGCGGSLSGNTYTTAPVTADCSVTASFKINTYIVTPSAGTGGSISPNAPQTVNHGSAASFTVTPDTGYSIAKVEGCGGTLSGSTYNTAPVTENCTVTASFIKLKKYVVIPLAGPNGTISPRRPQLVPHGSTVSFTVTPAAGYAVRSVFGCGGTLSGNIYTTGPISRNCAVVASFARIRRHFVIPSAGRHGSISPDSPQQVLHGAAASFTVTPNAGCRISKVTGCGGTLNGSIYTTAAVTRSCRVHAAFVK